jgi:uncharacterized protein (DUF1330 family)
LIAYSGKFIAKGSIGVLHGEAPFSTKVVIQFFDRDCAEKWYRSEAYQAIIFIHDQGMNSQYHLVG